MERLPAREIRRVFLWIALSLLISLRVYVVLVVEYIVLLILPLAQDLRLRVYAHERREGLIVELLPQFGATGQESIDCHVLQRVSYEHPQSSKTNV